MDELMAAKELHRLVDAYVCDHDLQLQMHEHINTSGCFATKAVLAVINRDNATVSAEDERIIRELALDYI